MQRYFEDFELGETVETRSLTVTDPAIVAFGYEYDPQPMHTSLDQADHVPFGRLIASGWQTAGWTMRLLVESAFLGTTGALGVGIDELRWHTPVFGGDTLRVRAEVLDLRPSTKKPRGYVRSKIQTYNQAGKEVLSMIATNVFELRSK